MNEIQRGIAPVYRVHSAFVRQLATVATAGSTMVVVLWGVYTFLTRTLCAPYATMPTHDTIPPSIGTRGGGRIMVELGHVRPVQPKLLPLPAGVWPVFGKIVRETVRSGNGHAGVAGPHAPATVSRATPERVCR